MADGFDAASQAKLRAVGDLLKEAQAGGTVRRAIAKDLRAPAMAVAARQRAAVRGLTGAAPSEWKTQVAANIRVVESLQTLNPTVSVALSGPATAIRAGRNLNRGQWRHPVFGRRNTPWVTQRVAPGWFDRTAQAARPIFIVAAARSLDQAADDLARRIDALNYWK